MTIAKKIQKDVSAFPDGFVFSISDFDCDYSQRDAAGRSLQRMAERGEISKLSNGKYYKPRQSVFGPLLPSPSQITKEFLTKDGKVIGYLTGASAFSQLSLTTQISSNIQIGTNTYRRPLKRGAYTISFVLQPNKITKESIELFKILDSLRFIKDVPAATPSEVCRRLIYIIKELTMTQIRSMAEFSLGYTPYVRAMLGAILELIGAPIDIINLIRESLSGITKYRIPISESVLPTKSNWRIYEPTRK